MNGRPKILFVTPGLRQGGAERQLLELIHRLPARFESKLCLFESGGIHYQDQLLPGQPEHVLGTKGMSVRALRKMIQVLREEQPDILHCYRDRANLWGRLAALYARPPIIITSVRNRAIAPLNLLTERHFAAVTDRVLTNSEGVRRELTGWAQVPSELVEVIPNFVDLAQFAPPSPAARTAARTRWGLAEGQFALLLPGRISMQKHQVGLAFALWQLRRQQRLPSSLRILFAGRERDWLYAQGVWALLRRFGLADQTVYLGSVNDMTSLYHASDAVVLPSLYEGMPNAVIEAQACGLPAVVSQAANADGLVMDGITGFEVPTAEAQDLAEALVRLFALPAAARSAMGIKGRARIMEHLDPDRLLARFVDLYDRLLAERGRLARPKRAF